jgi:hypothetical protein
MTASDANITKDRTSSWKLIAGVVVMAAAAFAYAKLGLYSIQPIGAIPEGATAIVWRESDEPFFNSADGMCLRRTGSVSLMCRMMAMGAAPKDRILLRLPYQRWAYLRSTDGKAFDR